ncbi:MAG: hypothetical protein U9Q68_09050, partial [Euryarchaeota archaeon]|nr:hypothetical protein [Euryarchaeota archaeon]
MEEVYKVKTFETARLNPVGDDKHGVKGTGVKDITHLARMHERISLCETIRKNIQESGRVSNRQCLDVR